MPSPKYPLKPLLEHRERAVDGATAELGHAVRRREEADAALARSEGELHTAEARAAQVKDAEAERLGRGELRAADLAQGALWESRVRGEIGALSSAVTAAERQLEGAKGQEDASRQGLARSMADRDVVAKDEARFAERVKKKALAAEEEAGEEAFRGGRKER